MSEVSEQLSTDSAKYIEQIINEQKLSKNMQYQNEQHKTILPGYRMSYKYSSRTTAVFRTTNSKHIKSSINLPLLILNAWRIFSTMHNASGRRVLGLQNLQMNAAQYKAIIEQMEKECYEQQVASDMQGCSINAAGHFFNGTGAKFTHSESIYKQNI